MVLIGRLMDGPQIERDSAVQAASRLPEPALIDLVVAELRHIERRSGIDRSLAIGELVLTRFFAGNADHWRDRRRNKNNSIRRLADRKDCPFCKSALNEAVAVYVAVLELPRVRTFGHICASHVACVLTLPDSARHEMLERAEQEHWSVRELRQHVIQTRRVQGELRGRPVQSVARRRLSALRALTQQLRVATLEVSGCELDGPATARQLHEIASDIAELGSELAKYAARTQWRPRR
jgi:hypothetical protein